MNLNLHDVVSIKVETDVLRWADRAPCYHTKLLITTRDKLAVTAYSHTTRLVENEIDLYSEEPIFDEQKQVFLNDRSKGKTEQVQSDKGRGCRGWEGREVCVEDGTQEMVHPVLDAECERDQGTQETGSVQV